MAKYYVQSGLVHPRGARTATAGSCRAIANHIVHGAFGGVISPAPTSSARGADSLTSYRRRPQQNQNHLPCPPPRARLVGRKTNELQASPAAKPESPSARPHELVSWGGHV